MTAPPPLLHAASLTVLCVVQGLLLDCDAATLTVWINDERKGVMVQPGMIGIELDEFGIPIADSEPVTRLEGPLRWAVNLSHSSVAVAGPLPPPS